MAAQMVKLMPNAQALVDGGTVKADELMLLGVTYVLPRTTGDLLRASDMVWILVDESKNFFKPDQIVKKYEGVIQGKLDRQKLADSLELIAWMTDEDGIDPNYYKVKGKTVAFLLDKFAEFEKLDFWPELLGPVLVRTT